MQEMSFVTSHIVKQKCKICYVNFAARSA